MVRPAHLYLVRPDGSIAQATDEPVMFPNGITSNDDGEIVVAESFAMALTAFRPRVDGTFASARPAADLTLISPDFSPDGLCAVPGQGIWVADPTGCRAVLVGPDGTPQREIATEHKCLDIATVAPAPSYARCCAAIVSQRRSMSNGGEARCERNGCKNTSWSSWRTGPRRARADPRDVGAARHRACEHAVQPRRTVARPSYRCTAAPARHRRGRGQVRSPKTYAELLIE
ncbi:SMP-30/gluconolactonase/LRE family protein [Nocardia sp. FBN12]|uniref:SMP-30/gluconolactonase/LRE family protein n=1 Tax=Nocardia sp. FBN12 TaxID=3419766 RepID=UPI003D04A75A